MGESRQRIAHIEPPFVVAQHISRQAEKQILRLRPQPPKTDAKTVTASAQDDSI